MGIPDFLNEFWWVIFPLLIAIIGANPEKFGEFLSCKLTGKAGDVTADFIERFVILLGVRIGKGIRKNNGEEIYNALCNLEHILKNKPKESK